MIFLGSLAGRSAFDLKLSADESPFSVFNKFHSILSTFAAQNCPSKKGNNPNFTQPTLPKQKR